MGDDCPVLPKRQDAAKQARKVRKVFCPREDMSAFRLGSQRLDWISARIRMPLRFSMPMQVDDYRQLESRTDYPTLFSSR